MCLMILMYLQYVTESAEMYEAAVQRFEDSPWQLNPAKTIHQVRGGAQVYSWLSNVFVNQLYTEAEQGWRGADQNANMSLMVGSFNRALKGRLTLKRRKLDRPRDALYVNSVAKSMSYQKTNAWAYRPSHELTTDFGSSMKFKYEEDKGFHRAGGYVQMLDFDLSKNDLMQQVTNLKENFWFDLSQGSLAVELLYYNGNVNRFLYVVFIFEHDFSGQTDVTVKVSPLSMGIHSPLLFTAWVRYFLYLVIVSFVIVFVKNEVEDMTTDYAGYFSQPMGYVTVCSFAFILYTMVLFFTMVFHFTFLNFRLPMDTDPRKQIEQFQSIAHLAGTNETFNVALGISTCLVVAQGVSLMTSLLSQWRLVSVTLSSMAQHLVAFLAIFFIMIVGFGQAGHWLLGLKMDAFRSTSRGILTVMEMVKGKANYKEIVREGGFFGDVYWFGLEFFFLIFQQFLTALISVGYFKQRAMQSDHAASPLHRFITSVKVVFQRYSGYARRIIVPITSLLSFGRTGGKPRADFEMVARLRDKRATKPVVRTVRYELRLGEKEDHNMEDPISTDVKLRAQDPFYPDGMMHYYVEETVPGGPARDFKVQKGFRLVGIKKDGLWDYKRFRDPKWFRDPDGSRGNPQGVLEGLSMPVQLEFQGRVRLFSLECIALLFFCGIFLTFSLQVARVHDVFSMVSLQKQAIAGTEWVDSKLSRVMSFHNLSIEETHGFDSWMTGIFMGSQMSCNTLPGGTECLESNETRSNWSLWVSNPNPQELNVSDLSNSTGLRLFQGSRPPSADGMSLGFVPDGPRRFNTSDVYPSPADTLLSRNEAKNHGVMRNNYARITFQLACYHPNKNDRFNQGYQYVIDDVLKNFGSCSSAPCMREMIKQKSECYTFNGEKQDMQKLYGLSSGLLYEYSETGTYLEQGGIVIGLGMNLEEAQTVWNLVSKDLLPAVVSFTMEYVDYNGNLDMFAWTKVSMDIKDTGKVGRSVESVVYPLNVFSMGYQEYAKSKMTANYVLFLLYILATFVFAGFLCRDLLVQLSLTSLSKPFYMFFSDFLQDDVMNALDVVTVICNVYILQDVLTYILLNGGLDIKKGFNSWTLDYGFSDSVTPDFVDPFQEFSKIAQIQTTFKIVVGLNGAFLSTRVLKYFRSLTSLRLVLSSVVAAMGEFLVLLAMIIVVLVAFVFMMYLRYGVLVSRYQTVFHATNELFLFLVGSLDTQDLWDIDPSFFFIIFMAYQVAFLLILNIFTAAITFRWKDARRDAEDFTISGAFRTLLDSLKFLRSTKNSAGAGDEKTLHKLDEGYWQDRSVLRHVRSLNSDGKITFGGGLYASHQDEDGKDDGEEDELAELGMDKEHHGPFDFGNPEHRRMFLQTFQKAHMEIASQKCLELEDRDTGAGVVFDGKFEDIEQATKRTLEQKLDDEEDAETMGIVEEDSQLHKAGAEITTHMNKKLEEHPRPAGEMSTVEEIWLDALVTVLEEAGALRQLQKLFLPIPMIIPKKTQEWGIFNQKKHRMEKRLNRFFGLLQEEARLKHYEYLKDMAVSKERVLKQQSLVLTDFLESLDSQIKRLQDEIKELSRQNASIQSHVSPLL